MSRPGRPLSRNGCDARDSHLVRLGQLASCAMEHVTGCYVTLANYAASECNHFVDCTNRRRDVPDDDSPIPAGGQQPVAIELGRLSDGGVLKPADFSTAREVP